jgi:hypothetical protein
MSTVGAKHDAKHDAKNPRVSIEEGVLQQFIRHLRHLRHLRHRRCQYHSLLYSFTITETIDWSCDEIFYS